LFSIAHINYTFNPFTLQYDPIQLVFAFIVGTVQGITYIKCKSIIYPLIMHSLCNVTFGIAGYLFAIYM
jgi:membrane protease YdiL (CAAX protease family)